MASMRDIKRRKASIQSTGQITKAMKLVSTVKLQKSRTRAEETRPYSDTMYATVQSILAHTQGITHPFVTGGGKGKKAVIVLTSNRGLAGGYNSNVVKLITQSGLPMEELVIYAVGKKGKDALARKGYEIAEDYSDFCENPEYADAVTISRRVLQDFKDGKIGEIYLACTRFKNTVVHEPQLKKLLPVEKELSAETSAKENSHDAAEGEEKNIATIPMNFEAEPEDVLSMLIPGYVTSLLFGALLEAAASENGARMQAMDSATSNAEEMISDLTLLYNRARQGSITQELTEIIAGAEAIS